MVEAHALAVAILQVIALVAAQEVVLVFAQFVSLAGQLQLMSLAVAQVAYPGVARLVRPLQDC